jgi:hypothetical protein
VSTAGCAHRVPRGKGTCHGVRGSFFVALLLVMAPLTACATQPGQASSTSTPNAAASQTADAAATRAAEPVRVDVTAQQEGALATHAAQLVVAVTVANHTPAPIHIYHIPCYGPLFDVELEVNHVAVTGNLDDDDPCLLDTIPVDKEPAIATGGAHTFTVTVDLKDGTLDPGAYALVAKVQWHQGSQDALDQLSAGQSDIPHGVAEGTGAITLQ